MLAPVTHILPLTTVCRERLLPTPGRLIARMDQKVGPTDVIAETTIGQKHVLLDVARAFRLPAEAVEAMIQVKSGDRVTVNQTIAHSTGLMPQILKSPADGRVMLSGGGQVLIEVGESLYELQAGMPGVVTRLIPERGAEITFRGALVQGVWGNGRLDTGLMLPILSQPDETLEASRVDVSLRGSVLLAGYCGDARVIRTGAELPIRGLLLASLAPALIPLAQQAPFPILVIDGFGQRPMNNVAYKLLTTNSKRETTLAAVSYDRHKGTRPEVFIPLPSTQDPPAPRDSEVFAPDQHVRLCRQPHLGEIGTLLTLQPGLTSLPSGVRVPAAQVKLENGEQILVPLANLEVVG
ncbi:MAG: hypothetical protein JXB85_01930 [Anaerolineales bacterium]|nr:hypothetical protein [Anaerolineales bacterium]